MQDRGGAAFREQRQSVGKYGWTDWKWSKSASATLWRTIIAGTAEFWESISKAIEEPQPYSDVLACDRMCMMGINPEEAVLLLLSGLMIFAALLYFAWERARWPSTKV